MPERLHWDTDGRDWPLREHSRFVHAGGLRWHVQALGAGPVVVLLHGTGASTHSWRALAPRLATDHAVVAMDLPGHGFTDPLPGPATLPAMAAALGALLHRMALAPALLVGHSAGAAIAARALLDGIAPQTRGLVSLNGALVPLHGRPLEWFGPLARMLAATPFVTRLFARQAAAPGAVERLLAGTGSRLDAEGVALYARLVRSPAHVRGALAMMAGWDLRSLERDLPRFARPLLLLAGTADLTVPPAESARVHALVPGAEFRTLPGLGHLMHEERPEEFAVAIREFLARVLERSGAGGSA